MSTTLPPEDVPAERAETQRRQLQRVADALAWSLEPRAVAAQLLDAACNALGAPRGWVSIRSEDDREAMIIAFHGYDPSVLEPWLRVPLDLDVPMTLVIRTGRAIHHASAAEREQEYPALREGGHLRFVQASAVVPMVFEGSTIGALSVSFDDVRTIDASDRWFLEALAAYGAGALERARLFEVVRERDDRLKLALETSGTWIWSWDLATNQLTWEPETAPFADDVAAPSTPEDWVASVHRDDRERVRSAMERCAAEGGSYEVEFRAGGAGEPVRWLAGIGQLLEGLSGRGRAGTVIGTVRDIPARTLAELPRTRRRAAERAAARLRDAFVGVVSHELRTPITTIFGGARVLSRRWREMDDASRDALLADVSGESDRLFRMVEDLLVLTRVERGNLDVGEEPVFLRPIVERVLASERTRSPEVTFESVIPIDLPPVQGEEMYVEQVLRNLLTNAAKYGGVGSRVRLEAGVAPSEVTLRVLDEGPGIIEGEAEQLFELFYRSPSTAPTVAGAGIGLFVCRQLVLAMGGSIRAENRPEGGADFELTLQRYADEGEPELG